MLTEKEINDRINKHITQLKNRNIADQDYTIDGRILRARIWEAQAILGIKPDEYYDNL